MLRNGLLRRGARKEERNFAPPNKSEASKMRRKDDVHGPLKDLCILTAKNLMERG